MAERTTQADVAPFPRGARTRFAPAPTGFLHLGHVANAIWAWGVAGATGGRVLLRIEDHDRRRSRPEYEVAVEERLDLTDRPHAPWHLVAAESKRHARVEVVRTVSEEIEAGMRRWGQEPPPPP